MPRSRIESDDADDGDGDEHPDDDNDKDVARRSSTHLRIANGTAAAATIRIPVTKGIPKPTSGHLKMKSLIQPLDT